LEFVLSDRFLFPCKWHEHVRAWLANPYQADLRVIRYEDLQANPVKELQRLCEFAEVDRPVEFLRTVARKATFEIMRRKEDQEGWSHPAWPRDKPFRRRGVVGSHQDEMPAEVLSAFLREGGDVLQQCGYV
jgi:hypothetical protein